MAPRERGTRTQIQAGVVLGIDVRTSEDARAVGWVVPSPSPGSNDYVYGGSVAGSDLWLAGDYMAEDRGTSVPFLDAPLIEHWNGVAWRLVQSPQPEGGSSALTDVSAISSTDAWAVGYDSKGPPIQHWNGSAWTRV